ncbi:ribosomal protein S18-alanine N-acetyltransferase [Microbacterium sp. cx-59]|uniref:ribosomal protein S18-alanine N-acetyltransferase n=1 Tax=Microbacterium sp. cx-59 TaxID=2891207 RepID=UPI001E542965|nr:ribosomal protein S18-alanine N-acetyltransferase [Microbacterium sp. cx-59]MCC4908009.1 ribosomal protein S18-alanine N-acetyltransferase [Microbacterium sp. cx-59]
MRDVAPHPQAGVIREATADDLGAIMALERASFPTDAWSTAMMRAELASPHGRYLVLERDGVLAGYAGLRSVVGAPDADIQTIAVSESERGRGSGRMLLRALIGIAHERRARTVFLEVRDDNPVAQQLYASEGFVETGRRPRYYQPDDVDAIVMTLDVPAWAARPVPPAAAASAAPAPVAPPATLAPAATPSPVSEMSPDSDAAARTHPNPVTSPNLATPADAGPAPAIADGGGPT